MRALVAALLLAGCAATPAPAVCVLPPLVAYSVADREALAGERRGVQSERWLEDYVRLRAQVRAAGGAPP